MKSVSLVLLIVFAAALIGCSSISVNHDYDREADFPAFKTFAWVPQKTTVVGDAKEAIRTNTLLDKRVRNAVNAELQGRGMIIDVDDPDILVAYHTGLDQKVNVTDWGYSYPRYYGGWGGGNIDVTTYEQGTLIVDLIDYKTSQLVWRGTATKALASNPTPEQMDKSINDIIQKLFSAYPPKV